MTLHRKARIRLLRRHEIGRPQRLPDDRQTGLSIQSFGQSEIRYMRLVRGRIDQDIRWLQIAMKHPLLMRVLNRFRDQPHIAGGHRGSDRAVAHELREVLPLDVIHREVMLARVDAHIVDRNEIWMPQRRRSAGFRAKTVDQLPGGEVAAQHHLQRHDSAQGKLSRLVDDTHAAARDLFDQFIVAKNLRRDFLAGNIALVRRFQHLKQTIRTTALRRVVRERLAARRAGGAFGIRGHERVSHPLLRQN